MKRWGCKALPAVPRVWRDRRGVTSVVIALTATVLLGMAALAVDVGTVLTAHAALQANADAAALDGAYTWSQPGNTVSDGETAAQAWHTSHAVPNVTVTGAVASTACITTTSGLPACTSSAPNVITVTQSAVVPTIFARVLGINSVNVSVTAAASEVGGPAKPLNVMFVLDSTQSMNDNDDTGCSVPGMGTPTRFQCAMYGVQLVLQQLDPTQDKVGLMVFPGLASVFQPCSSFPKPVQYGAPSVNYQVSSASSLDNTYKNSSGALVNSSPIVEAVGDAPSLQGCLQAPGGEGTYYAQMLSMAQTALQNEGVSGHQNVIILLSDGAANATSGLYSSYANSACSPSTVCAMHSEKQCNQAVVQAQTAAAAGTWIYSIAYDAPTTASSSGCPTVSGVVDKSSSGTQWTPCTTMQQIASDQTKFYSTSGSCLYGPNSYSDVASAFKQVGNALSRPRLVMQ